EGTGRAAPHRESKRRQCLTLVSGSETRRERRKPHREPRNRRHSTGAVTPVNARPIIRRTVQRSPSAVPTDGTALNELGNLIRMGTTTISVTWQLGESATVNLTKFLIVLVRTTPVD